MNSQQSQSGKLSLWRELFFLAGIFLSFACSSSDPWQTFMGDIESVSSTEASVELRVYHWTCLHPTGILTHCHVSARFASLQACQDLLSQESEIPLQQFHCSDPADFPSSLLSPMTEL